MKPKRFWLPDGRLFEIPGAPSLFCHLAWIDLETVR